MEDIIVIKPRRGQHALYIISLVFLLFAAVAMMDVVLSLSVLIFTYSIILNLYFLDTRTLIISRQGICAKFGLYKRDYKWSDFKCICLQNYKKPDIYSRECADEAIVLSAKQSEISIKRSHKTQSFLHPLSFLYISFCSDDAADTYFPEYGWICYRANKREVLSKFAEWGVEVKTE